MGARYRISTLLYCFNPAGQVLLLERAQEPNKGLWSPPGGKLDVELGESPYACACREAGEEIGIQIAPSDIHLIGLVSEEGSAGEAHWLMFLFEVNTLLTKTPPAHREGRFEFFSREAVETLAVPRTDREQIWPLVWQHRGGFFAARCRANPLGTDEWFLEESRSVGGLR